jgi:hypothetical protein
MAHYVFLDANNVVVSVISGVEENETQIDLDGTVVGGSTEAWEQFYQNQPWHEGLICKRTSDANDNYRKQFGYVGFTYDAQANVFVAPKPFVSWTLDSNHDWQPPVPKPLDNEHYEWDERQLKWILLSSEFINEWVNEWLTE